ncbi:hypothetical protein CC78DRAFT_581780 [Lojkania enalia]|uniref:Uncharacterized protein n=1 Tax=Lojkania enalia TaxID=147567 RepID=A0A9P4N337_9PLEO|nr:hypothetical protein CC78DRAFT_581780 [Didymosphaeria enalia]
MKETEHWARDEVEQAAWVGMLGSVGMECKDEGQGEKEQEGEEEEEERKDIYLVEQAGSVWWECVAPSKFLRIGLALAAATDALANKQQTWLGVATASTSIGYQLPATSYEIRRQGCSSTTKNTIATSTSARAAFQGNPGTATAALAVQLARGCPVPGPSMHRSRLARTSPAQFQIPVGHGVIASSAAPACQTIPVQLTPVQLLLLKPCLFSITIITIITIRLCSQFLKYA